MNDHNASQWIGNAVSGAAIITTMFGLLPAIAAGVALIWYFIQIYESATVKQWLAHRRNRKLARLKARVLMMEAQSKPPLPGPDNYQ
jgi:hypothetical protein